MVCPERYRQACPAATHRARLPTPRGFILNGTHYPAQSWIDMLSDLSRLMIDRHPDRIERLFGRAAVFSTDPNSLRQPRLIPGTGIYLSRKQGRGAIIENALWLASQFGYSERDFAILEPD